MMNPSRRQIFPSNKRYKERESDDGPTVFKKPSTFTTKTLAKPSLHRPATKPLDQPPSSNMLLAGYLAHEFLAKGTLFGQPWEPSPADSVPLSAASRNQKPSSSQKLGTEPQGKAEKDAEDYQRYMEVADLFKTDGAHIQGVFNPSQLARFLQQGR